MRNQLKKISRFLPFLLAILVIIGFWRLTNITKVICKSQDGDSCPSQINSILNQYQGSSILTIKKLDLKSRVENTGLVSSQKLELVFPSTLNLTITTQKDTVPLAVYFYTTQFSGFSYQTATSSSELYKPSVELTATLTPIQANNYSIYPDGTLVEIANFQPKIIYISPGIPEKDALKKVFEQASQFQLFGNYKNVFYFNDLIIVSIDKEPDLIFSTNQDPFQYISTLQKIRQEGTMKEIKLIDFRFKHPILK